MIKPVEFIEKYKTIDCFGIKSGYYEASNMGEIREIHSGRVLNQTYRNGYLSVYLKREGYSRGKSFSSHRIIANMFCNPNNIDVSDYVINHYDLIRDHNAHYNLEFCTQKENIAHAIRLGAFKIGEDSSSAKLNDKIVRRICELLVENNLTYSNILLAVGLEDTKQNLDIVTKIRTKKLWVHISKEYDLPEKEYRSKQMVYTDDQLHLICKLLEKGYASLEIGRSLGIPLDTRNEQDKLFKFLNRIKARETYTHISAGYKF